MAGHQPDNPQQPNASTHSSPQTGQTSSIRHAQPNFGGPAMTPTPSEEPVPVAPSEGPVTGSNKITAFGSQTRHEEQWNRTPNTTGTGAIHVKTFHSKLTDDALRYLDQTVNEWLDAHPQYEVKFVTTTVGTVTGKSKEPHLICQVWV